MLLSPLHGVALTAHHALATLANVSFENAADLRNPLYRPEDPSTLTLAVIGVATLAVYFARSRTLRSRRTPPMLSNSDTPVQQIDPAAQQPSRGAA